MTEQQEEVQNKESIRERLDKYNRLQRMSNWVGGGLVALAALMTTNIVGHDLFRKLVITGIVLSGVLVGHARQKFDWRETQLRRDMARDCRLSEDNEVPDSHRNFLNQTLRLWKGALICTLLTGLAFLIGIWWAELGNLWSMIIRCPTG